MHVVEELNNKQRTYWKFRMFFQKIKSNKIKKVKIPLISPLTRNKYTATASCHSSEVVEYNKK